MIVINMKKKKIDWGQMVVNAKTRVQKTNKKENIDHDLIAYGVSRSK